MTRKAYIWVKDFGSQEQLGQLAHDINDQTLFHAVVIGEDVLIEIKLHEIAHFFDVMQSNDTFNWIEFSVQLAH